MRALAWGAKVSPDFRTRVVQMAATLRYPDPSDIMAVMAFETGETFSPKVRNGAGSGATGLIQFMPQTAAALGYSVNGLAVMTAVQQLSVVEAYFLMVRRNLHTLEDLYMAVLWPVAIGMSDDYVLFDKADAQHPKSYIQNAGLDFNHDGKITKAEAAARVRLKLLKGLEPPNVWTGA